MRKTMTALLTEEHIQKLVLLRKQLHENAGGKTAAAGRRKLKKYMHRLMHMRIRLIRVFRHILQRLFQIFRISLQIV